MKRTLKAGRCLLVLALLAGPAIERSFAGDAAPGAKRAPLGQVKTKFGSRSAGMPQPQRPSTAQTTGRVVRNAIGLPVGHAEGLVRGDGVRHEAPALAQGRAAGALGIAAGGSGSLAKLQGSLGGMRIVYPSPSPTAKMMPNPANIGGNIVVRRGAGASGVVGGPAKTVGGINGTAIRPKH